MATKRRWIETMLKESARSGHKMPWERGARRAAFIARRAAAPAQRTVARA